MVEATLFLQEGASVPIIVARQGNASVLTAGAGGGGLSAVYTNGNAAPTIVAGPAIFATIAHLIQWLKLAC